MDFSESSSNFIFVPRPRPIPGVLGPDRPLGFLTDKSVSRAVRPGVEGRGDRDGDELDPSSAEHGFFAARGDCGRGEVEVVGVE